MVRRSVALQRERLLFLAALTMSITSCAGLDPRPGPVLAIEPRPNPPLSRAAGPVRPASTQVPDMQFRLRQSRWLTYFRDALTPAQQRLRAARMRSSTRGVTLDAADIGRRWDVLGLAERARLVFGSGAAVTTPILHSGDGRARCKHRRRLTEGADPDSGLVQKQERSFRSGARLACRGRTMPAYALWTALSSASLEHSRNIIPWIG
jgi:hypothetical protein